MWSGSEDLKGLFRLWQLLAAAHRDLTGQRSGSREEELHRQTDRQREVLDVMLTAERKLQGAELPAAVQQLVVMKEEPPEQQEWSSSLQQEDSEPPHIKEEQEELWSSQEGLEEAETTKFTLTPVPVKSEDEEEKPQSSQLHHRQSQQMETGPEIEVKIEDSSEAETEDSDEWEESRERQSGFNSVDSLSDERTNTEQCLQSGSEFGETFKEKTLLTKHSSIQEGEKLFSCSYCGRMFSNKGNLIRHTMAHTSEKPFSCPECGKGFTLKSNLTLHLAQHRGKPYSCSDCQETFCNYSLLVTHMRMHRGLKRFICSVCGKEWRSRSKLEIHLRVHTAEKPRCSDCGTRYSSLYHVNHHRCVRKSEHLIKTGFQSQDDAESEPEEDLDPDTGKGTSPSVSPKDGAEFWKKRRKRRSAVTYQRKQKVPGDNERHPDFKPFTLKHDATENEPKTQQTDQMDLCTQSKLQTDLDPLQDEDLCETEAGIHLDPSERSHSEGETGSETGSGLERPLTDYTAEGQPLGDVYESTEPPQTQTGGPLTAKRLLSCPQCGGGFIEEQDLLVHMRIHIKEHLFSCSLCGQRFATRDSLTSHVSSHAVGEPFCCSVCDPGFPHSQSECEHMRGVAEQTRFHCFCGEEFTWRRHLIRHMEGHRPGSTEFRYLSCSKSPSSKTHQSTKPVSAEPETTDREGAWMDSRGPESGFNSPHTETLVSDMEQVLHPESHQSSDNHRVLETYKHSERESLSHKHQEAPRGIEQEDLEPWVIKEEQEEVWIAQAETTKFTVTPVPVKSEDEEEKPQSSQLHHRQSQQMETGADGGDSAGPGPEDPVSGIGLYSKTLIWDDEASERLETKSDDSVDSDFWKEEEAQRKMNSLTKEDVPKSCKGNKIYICFKCGQRFHVLGDLRSHEKRIHRMKEKKKRTFPCSVCGHVCPYLSHLKIHMRRHTGEKPFVCQKCGKKYAQKENLRIHLLKHSRESPLDTESS